MHEAALEYGIVLKDLGMPISYLKEIVYWFHSSRDWSSI
jgi:hypothetical protein